MTIKRYYEGQPDKGHRVERAHGNEGEYTSSLGTTWRAPSPTQPRIRIHLGLEWALRIYFANRPAKCCQDYILSGSDAAADCGLPTLEESQL